MAEHTPGEPEEVAQLIKVDDGDMHVVESGKLDAHVTLLIHGSAASVACWDLVIPALTGAHRVIRVDLLGCGKSTNPDGGGGYDIPAQARRIGVVLDTLGVNRVTVIGHSSGCAVATALAEQRPDEVVGLTLIDFGPSLESKTPEKLLFRLLLTQVPGQLLWRLRTEANIRKAARVGFTRPVDYVDSHCE
jgi:pimeloyl-ACP methyl ester carboxylesterase